MNDRSVVIAGAGPTGLMLAGELALAGIDVAIVERCTSQLLDRSRSRGLHSRTLEVLDQRGIADRFLAAGQAMQVQGFAGIPLDISDFPSRHNYGLALTQNRFEPILAEWVSELGVPIFRGQEVVGVSQDTSGVDATLADGTSLRAEYLVGCDGGRSLVRKSAGIDFPGLEPSTSWMIAEVELDQQPHFGMHPEGGGIGPAEDGWIGVALTEHEPQEGDAPSLEELRAGLIRVYGTDYGLRRANSISRFSDTARQAASYRLGRVLVAGDAAHVHPPQGGRDSTPACRMR